MRDRDYLGQAPVFLKGITGDSGNGMTGCTMGAMLVADLM